MCTLASAENIFLTRFLARVPSDQDEEVENPRKIRDFPLRG